MRQDVRLVSCEGRGQHKNTCRFLVYAGAHIASYTEWDEGTPEERIRQPHMPCAQLKNQVDKQAQKKKMCGVTYSK